MRIVSLIWLSVGIAASLQAQTFRAYANASTVVEGSSFTLSFELDGSRGKDFVPPSFDGFEVLSGPSTSQSTTIINGRMSSKYVLNYNLFASKPGSYTIRPAKIRAGKNVLRSQPITIKVVKKGKTDGGEDFFVRAEIKSDTAYVGQQLRFQLKLYTKVRVERFDLVSQPEFGDIYVEEVSRYDRQSSLEVVDGIQYSTQILREMALYPQKSGSYDLNGFVMRLGIPDANARRNNSFFFSSRLRTTDVKTNDVRFEVVPLPEPKPISYSGGIGDYKVQMKSDRTRLSTDDALSLVVIIQGNGDKRMLAAPDLNLGEDFEVYDANELSTEMRRDRGHNFVKSFEYLIVPKKSGELCLDPEFSYFQPDSGRYITRKIDSLWLEVRQGTAEGKALEKFKEEQELELAPIQTAWKSNSSNALWSRSLWYKGFLGLWGLMFFGLFWVKSKWDADRAMDPKMRKYLKARKAIESRLERAKAFEEPRAYHEELSLAIKQYFCDKLDMEMSQFTKENLAQKLLTKGVDTSNVTDIIDVLKQCEYALFAPAGLVDMKESFEKAVDTILHIDSSL